MEDKEEIQPLLDALAEASAPTPGRNDLCWCGSGKKYKKCCINKNNKTTPCEVSLEAYTVIRDELPEEECTPLQNPLSPEDKELISALYHQAVEHPNTIDSENCDYFQRLNILLIKYPDNPTIFNYITIGYERLGWQDQAEEWIAATYERFPHYLFAKTAQATLHLRKSSPEKALEVLNGSYSLKQLYPHRNVFHVSEVTAFEHLMVQYFYKMENMEQAAIHLRILEQFLDDDSPSLQNARQLLKELKIIHNLMAGMSHILTVSKNKKKK